MSRVDRLGRIALGEVKRNIEQTRRKKAEITDLVVSNIKLQKFTPELNRMLEQLVNLRFLYMAECCLESLNNMPQLPGLEQIDLTANRIVDDEVRYLKKFKRLRIVSLGFNQLCNVQILQQLSSLTWLQQLQLYENPIAQLPEYRTKVFEVIKSLKILDGQDKHGRIIEEIDDYDQDLILEAPDQDSDVDWESEKIEGAREEQFEGEDRGSDEEQIDINEEMENRPQRGKRGRGAKRGGRRGRGRGRGSSQRQLGSDDE